jgi:hypothetical protein
MRMQARSCVLLLAVGSCSDGGGEPTTILVFPSDDLIYWRCGLSGHTTSSCNTSGVTCIFHATNFVFWLKKEEKKSMSPRSKWTCIVLTTFPYRPDHHTPLLLPSLFPSPSNSSPHHIPILFVAPAMSAASSSPSCCPLL